MSNLISCFVLISRSDGGVSIMSIQTKKLEYLQKDGKTIEQIVNNEIDCWKASSPGEYIAHVIVSPDLELPKVFRNAWEMDKDKIKVNMEKAREIHKDRLRNLREPILQKLDIAYMRALESNDTSKVVEIVNRKNELRNITDLPELSTISSPDELSNFIPSSLIDQS